MKVKGVIEYGNGSSQRSATYPGESPFAKVNCDDGKSYRWFYDECKYYPRPQRGWEIAGTVNKFGNLCHVKVIKTN